MRFGPFFLIGVFYFFFKKRKKTELRIHRKSMHKSGNWFKTSFSGDFDIERKVFFFSSHSADPDVTVAL